MPASRTPGRAAAPRTASATSGTPGRTPAGRTPTGRTPAGRTPTGRTPAGRPPESRAGAAGAKRSPARPPLTPAEARALREALALRQAAAARPGITPEQLAAARAAVAARTGGSGSRRPSGSASTRGRPAAGRTAVRRATAPSRRSRSRAPRTGSRWSTRLGVVATSALLLPAALAVLLPAAQAPDGGGSALDPTTLALTARSSLLEQADLYQQLADEADQRRARLEEAQAAEDAARAELAARQRTVGAGAAQLYRADGTSRYPVLGLDLDQPRSTATSLTRQALADRAGRALEGDVVRAERTATRLQAAVTRVADARAALAAAEQRAAEVLAAMRDEAGGLPAEVTGRLAGLGALPAAGPQQQRNEAATRRWQEHLGRLAAAGIAPPPAAALADPAAFPAGLSPALDADGRPVPGVAWAVIGSEPVTVPAAETVAAVSNALSQLGKPFVAGTAGPGTYGCGGFTAASWLLAGYALPGDPGAQWASGAPVPVRDVQIGDLVFAPGGQDVGIYLGAGEVVGASAASFQVAVTSTPAGSSAVRVTLPRPAGPNPALPAGGGTGACGAPLPEPGPVDPQWGGWSNGRIPAEALCRLGVGRHALRCDAAAAYAQLDAAYTAEFGTPLRITDSYRSFGAQVAVAVAKPALAAVPGTSNHGWALAIDLGGGVHVARTPQWNWMTANAARFGWVQPDWARPGGEKPEPWHWEFGHIS
ncbi:Cell wall-associated hydrolase, NlpC family [Blastococcus sp. DSM 46786]|uniref:D-alanyl-D-alanine carboxypeptidase family protein n=1 Tax=Blastococcus sp. DSM 46786 TaxID=1798227 RepID=UPI0008BA0CBF|nr:D-alanyl-D-alanine carboxypeptidase family protein [Blastococcus sp. DSM 46786]SEL17208.1 Cell wall-associated hydrolase, NlpC family [Blastococcus sp. DSM 46786]